MPSVRLRPWQKRALDLLDATDRPDFLAVATPGAGKTTFALAAAVARLAARPGRRLLVVAPTAHLKTQWALAAARFGLHLEPSWTTREGVPGDMHGVVVTYQQVAADADGVRRAAHDAVVVLDELHHAGDEQAWGDAVRLAFAPATHRLALSGTPFRSDTQAIPFVRYEADRAVPDFEYGYDDALADGGVVRPIHFPRVDGAMEWTAPDGTHRAHTFAEQVARDVAGQRLRTALSVGGEWLPAILKHAHGQLQAVRATQPDAGGLVIATDQDHARGIAELLRERQGTRAVVVTSDDPRASARIAAFAAGTEEWIVAVRMVSEGVDVPRLRVGVYATTITTELFFRQAVGRLVRWTPGVRRQRAYMFVPDDPRLRACADALAEQRRHLLVRAADDDEQLLAAERPPRALHDAEQPSLFAAISAVAIGGADAVTDVEDEREPLEPPETGYELALAPPPLPRGARGGGQAGEPRAARKADVRRANAVRAREIARRAALTHAVVNRQLNERAGIAKIGTATLPQLERRLRAAEDWLARL